MTLALELNLRDFVGTWSVERRITDLTGGPDARFTGIATFKPTDGGLLYSETGELELHGHAAFKAERQYRWRQESGEIAVDFSDGRPFHRFAPNEATASHWCDPDTYKVSYEFDTWPNWTSIWDVSGPKKPTK